MMKPLLTVMGSFQSEVTPATADNACRGSRSRRLAITRALPSVTGSSSHALQKVHFPAQLGTLPRDKCLFAFNLLRAEEAQRKQSITGKNVFISALLEGPPNEGGSARASCLSAYGGHGGALSHVLKEGVGQGVRVCGKWEVHTGVWGHAFVCLCLGRAGGVPARVHVLCVCVWECKCVSVSEGRRWCDVYCV